MKRKPVFDYRAGILEGGLPGTDTECCWFKGSLEATITNAGAITSVVVIPSGYSVAMVKRLLTEAMERA